MKKIIKNKITCVKSLNLTKERFREIVDGYKELDTLEVDLSDKVPNLEAYLGGEQVEYSSVNYYSLGKTEIQKYRVRISRLQGIEEKIFFKGQNWTGNGNNKNLHTDIYINPSKYQYRFIILKGIFQGIKFLDSVETAIKEKEDSSISSIVETLKSRKFNKKEKALLIKALD